MPAQVRPKRCGACCLCTFQVVALSAWQNLNEKGHAQGAKLMLCTISNEGMKNARAKSLFR